MYLMPPPRLVDSRCPESVGNLGEAALGQLHGTENCDDESCLVMSPPGSLGDAHSYRLFDPRASLTGLR